MDLGSFELNSSANGGSYRALLPMGRLNIAYDQPIIPNNGSFNYFVSSGNLPFGLGLTTSLAPNSVVAVSGIPRQGGTFDFSVTATDGTNSNVTDYRLFVIMPTSAGVKVSGRVLTAASQGIRNATITVSGHSLKEPLMVTTGAFGAYSIEGLQAGETYVITVNSQRYTFAVPSRVVTLSDSIADLDFTAEGTGRNW